MAQTALETLLWRRGIGLEIHRCANRLARHDPEVRNVLDTIRFNRANYAARLFDAPSDSELRPRHGMTMKLEIDPIEANPDYRALEDRLFKRLEPPVNRFVSRPPDCAELASRIPDDGLLIEYWRCTWPVDNQGSIAASYVALVLPKKRPDMACTIHLCKSSEIEDTLFEYLSLLSGRSKTADFRNEDEVQRDPARAREVGQRLRSLLLDPLSVWTEQAGHLLLVPDGLLVRLPFSTLPLGHGYVMDRWLISYLHSARDLFENEETLGLPSSPIVVSDPAYDWPGRMGRSTFFEPLDCAAQEGKTIGHLLGVKPLTETAATKSALMTCGSPKILHIATHGQLLPAQPTIADLGQISQVMSGVRWFDPGEARLYIPGLAVFADNLGRLSGLQLPDQALRSVLALAGANTWLEGSPLPDEAGNGLVTAEDIVAMDLAANQLTVLSACETGLGVIDVGEGVLGLRSSFAIAGAETVVVSLWSVDDSSTEQLMCTFYQNLIEGHMGRAKALQEAQRAIRNQYPDDPYFWGSFICQGASGPLAP